MVSNTVFYSAMGLIMVGWAYSLWLAHRIARDAHGKGLAEGLKRTAFESEQDGAMKNYARLISTNNRLPDRHDDPWFFDGEGYLCFRTRHYGSIHPFKKFDDLRWPKKGWRR